MPDAPPAQPLRVLVVEDEQPIALSLKQMLEHSRYQVAVTYDGKSGIEQARTFRPHTALVDYRLGEMNGMDVSRSLREMDKDLPVILMTAFPSLELAVEALKGDIYDFITKPIDVPYLLRAVGKALEKRQLTEEIQRLIADLKAKNAQLENLNQMKTKFLSIVTHDLKTPLTAVGGYTELLNAIMASASADARDCLAGIDSAVRQMNTLIGNLLDLVSIEAGKLRVEKRNFDYAETLAEQKRIFAPIGMEKKVALEWKIPPHPVRVFGDPNRLVQVIGNLVSNAFRHTPKEGRITVRASVAKEEGAADLVLTEVEDTGQGVSPQDQSRIFEQFYQAEASGTRRGSLGIGLSICKEIVQGHEGEIGVSSEGPGKGSRFWFKIPLARA